MEANIATARLTNPGVQFIGISVNTSQLDEKVALEFMDKVESEFGLPVVDPFRQGVSRIVNKLSEV